jgi:DnaJ-class molecular chaperone
MARKYHPDLNQTIRKLKERKFKELNEANEVLVPKTVKYDEYGENWQNAEQYSNQRQQQHYQEVDNKLISVAVERIIRTLNLCLAGAPQEAVVM